MAAVKWFLADEDARFFELELDDFVPAQLYDSHMHLGPRNGYDYQGRDDSLDNMPEVADMAYYRDLLHWMVPGREVVGANILPSTLNGRERAHGNAFVAGEAATDSISGNSLVIHPAMTAAELRDDISRHHPVSLKPYYMM